MPAVSTGAKSIRLPNAILARIASLCAASMPSMSNAGSASAKPLACASDRNQAHIEEVKRTIAPERLFVFQVSEGWSPLCRFLDVPVPAEPFPRVNERENFGKDLPGGKG